MKITAMLTALVVLFFTTISCEEKLLTAAKNKDISIKEAFTQTEVPGQENSKPNDYLNLNLSVKDGLDFTPKTVLYKGQRYAATTYGEGIKINLSKGTLNQNEEKIEANQAILFYTLNGKEGQLLINNIEAREPIYLP